jgi:S-adenosylmethionine decarboxylase proenzyme
MNVSSLGNHIILDLFKINKDIFENKLSFTNFPIFDDYIKKSLIKNNMTLLNSNIHFFDNNNGALTALYLLSESHLSIHTWPENNYIAIDVFTCGNCDTEKIVEDLIKYLEPKKIIKNNIKRGEEKKKSIFNFFYFGF